MKVAFLMMKGFDGCGVSRFAVEHQLELRRTGNVCDIYSFDKKYVRAKSHSDKDVIYYKDIESLDLEQYDYLILNSYLQEFDQKTFDYIKGLNVKKCAMMHEITRQNYNKIDHLWNWIDICDCVSSFSLDMDFVEDLRQNFPFKPYFSFKMAMFENDMDRLYNNSLDVERVPRLVYFGRWTTMKDPSRLFVVKEADKSIDCKMIGIERSIGAVGDIFDNPYCQDFSKTGFVDKLDILNVDGQDDTKVQVFSAIDRDVAFEYLRQSMFGCSFYRLRDSKINNLGNRMEFTQIELSCITLPVFDINWGKNTFDAETGKSLYELGDNAIYSDRENIQDTIDEIKRLSYNKDEYNRRRKNMFDIVKRNYCSTTNIPYFYSRLEKCVKEN